MSRLDPTAPAFEPCWQVPTRRPPYGLLDVVIGKCDLFQKIWPSNRIVAAVQTCRALKELVGGESLNMAALLHMKKDCATRDLQWMNLSLYRAVEVELSIGPSAVVRRDVLRLFLAAAARARDRSGWRGPSRLVASRAGVGGDDAAQLAAGMSVWPALEDLDLSFNSVGPDGAAAIAAALGSCPALSALSLGANSMGTQGAAQLAAALPAAAGLTHLDLHGNLLGPEAAGRLAAALPACRGLRRLDLSDNLLGPDGAGRLAAVLPACAALADLELWNNRAGDDGAARLAAALPACAPLRRLGLRRNNLSDAGAARLAAALPAAPGLEELDLRDNRVRGPGAACLAAALAAAGRMGGGLRCLALDSNFVGDGGAQSFADALPFCTGLRSLRLCNNEITEAGERVLRAAAPDGVALQLWDLEILLESRRRRAAAAP